MVIINSLKCCGIIIPVFLTCSCMDYHTQVFSDVNEEVKSGLLYEGNNSNVGTGLVKDIAHETKSITNNKNNHNNDSYVEFNSKIISDVKEIYSNGYLNFVALKKDKTVEAWGSLYNSEFAAVKNELKNVKKIFATGSAFAALKEDGTVVTWGEAESGGDSSNVKAELINVKDIYFNNYAFIAIKQNGSVVIWGDKEHGGDPNYEAQYTSKLNGGDLTDIVNITATEFGAFAALKEDGTVVTWGDRYFGGDSSSVRDELHDVKKIYSTGNAFAALRFDGSVVTWGGAKFGGDSSKVHDFLRSGVVSISSTRDNFAALKADGSVVFWGMDVEEFMTEENIKELKNVIKISSTYRTFIFLKADGTVIGIGDSFLGENISEEVQEQLKQVRDIYSASKGKVFAALKSDGTVVSWGCLNKGEDFALVQSKLKNVKEVIVSASAFTALKSDGTVVSWGDPMCGGIIPDDIASQLTDIVKVYSSNNGFAALKANGSVISWGNFKPIDTSLLK